MRILAYRPSELLTSKLENYSLIYTAGLHIVTTKEDLRKELSTGLFNVTVAHKDEDIVKIFLCNNRNDSEKSKYISTQVPISAIGKMLNIYRQ